MFNAAHGKVARSLQSRDHCTVRMGTSDDVEGRRNSQNEWKRAYIRQSKDVPIAKEMK